MKYIISCILLLFFSIDALSQNISWTKLYDIDSTSETGATIHKINKIFIIISLSENYPGGIANDDVLPTLRILNYDGDILFQTRYNQSNLTDFKKYIISKVIIVDSTILINGTCNNKSNNKRNNFSLLLSINGTYLNSKFDSTHKYEFITSTIISNKIIELYSELVNNDTSILHSEQYNKNLIFINHNSIPYHNLSKIDLLNEKVLLCQAKSTINQNIVYELYQFNADLNTIKYKLDTSNIQTNTSQFYNFSPLEIREINGKYILMGCFYGLKNNPRMNGLELDYYLLKIDTMSLAINSEYYGNKFNRDSDCVSINSSSLRIKEYSNSVFVLSKTQTSNSISSSKFRLELINNNDRLWVHNLDSVVPNISTGFSVNIIHLKSNIIASNYLYNKGLILNEYDLNGNNINSSIDSLEPTLINSGVNTIVEGDLNFFFIFGQMYTKGKTDSDLLLKKIYWNSTGTNNVFQTNNTVIIYPIPAYDQLNFKSDFNNLTYNIYNFNGEVIIKGIIKESKINIEFIPKGVYYLRIYTSNGNMANYTFVK